MKNKAAAPYSRVTDKGVTAHTKMGKPLSVMPEERDLSLNGVILRWRLGVRFIGRHLLI